MTLSTFRAGRVGLRNNHSLIRKTSHGGFLVLDIGNLAGDRDVRVSGLALHPQPRNLPPGRGMALRARDRGCNGSTADLLSLLDRPFGNYLAMDGGTGACELIWRCPAVGILPRLHEKETRNEH